MTKEDANLVCPISFHGTTWSKLLSPLRQLSFNDCGTSAGVIANSKLDIRYVQDSVGLFHDLDHPFRWFLAPYCSLYFVNASTVDDYKDRHRPAIRKWIEASFGQSKRWKPQWLLVYVSIDSESAEAVNDTKVYSKLAGDFYVDKAGDRSVHLCLCTGDVVGYNSIDNAPELLQETEPLVSRLRMCIVESFLDRGALYEKEIQRLKKNPNSIDFRQLFLVKESLALMYQIMDLGEDALRQYEELDALIQYTLKFENGVLSGHWPFIAAPDPLNSSDSGSGVGVLTEALAEGRAVLQYSINSVRMRILKSEIGLLELKRYVFARQMFFLPRRKAALAKSFDFMRSMFSEVRAKLLLLQHTFPGQHLSAQLEYCQVYLAGASLTLATRGLEDAHCNGNDNIDIELAALLQFACSRMHALNCYCHPPALHRLEAQSSSAPRVASEGAADFQADSSFMAPGVMRAIRRLALVAANALTVESCEITGIDVDIACIASEIAGEDEVLQLLSADGGAVDKLLPHIQQLLHEALALTDSSGRSSRSKESKDTAARTEQAGGGAGASPLRSAPVVWLLLSTSMLHAVALLETAAGRLTVARWYRSLCGDVLLVSGFFDSARRCYETALAPGLPIGAMADGTVWTGLSKWLYRKAIYAAVASGDCTAVKALADASRGVGVDIMPSMETGLPTITTDGLTESDDEEGKAWGFEAVSGEQDDDEGLPDVDGPLSPPREISVRRQRVASFDRTDVGVAESTSRLHASCCFVRAIAADGPSLASDATSHTAGSSGAWSRLRVLVQTDLLHGRGDATNIDSRSSRSRSNGDSNLILEIVDCGVSSYFAKSDNCELGEIAMTASLLGDSSGSFGARFVTGRQLFLGERLLCAFQIAVEIGEQQCEVATRTWPGSVIAQVDLRFRYRLLLKGNMIESLTQEGMGDEKEQVLRVEFPFAAPAPGPLPRRTAVAASRTLPADKVALQWQQRGAHCSLAMSMSRLSDSTSTRIFTTAISVSNQQISDCL